MKNSDKILAWAVELQAIAQTGLYYCENKFDIERFERIRDISAEMIALKSDISTEKVKGLFFADSGYCTPKIDTRGAIFKDNKILLVQESDGRWTMPGGWCDVDCSPAENTIKEVKEEAGLDVTVDKLVAVQDRAKHNARTYAFGVAKMFFICTAVGGEFQKNIETIDSKYFSENEIPENLATEKCTAKQIKLCFQAYHAEFWETVFDQ